MRKQLSSIVIFISVPILSTHLHFRLFRPLRVDLWKICIFFTVSHPLLIKQISFSNTSRLTRVESLYGFSMPANICVSHTFTFLSFVREKADYAVPTLLQPRCITAAEVRKHRLHWTFNVHGAFKTRGQFVKELKKLHSLFVGLDIPLSEAQVLQIFEPLFSVPYLPTCWMKRIHRMMSSVFMCRSMYHLYHYCEYPNMSVEAYIDFLLVYSSFSSTISLF